MFEISCYVAGCHRNRFGRPYPYLCDSQFGNNMNQRMLQNNFDTSIGIRNGATYGDGQLVGVGNFHLKLIYQIVHGRRCVVILHFRRQ